MAPTGGLRAARVLAQINATSGTDLANILLGIIGTFIMVVLAARALAAFADERYGKMVTLIAAAIPIIGFAYLPEVTLNILKALFTTFVGGNGGNGGGGK